MDTRSQAKVIAGGYTIIRKDDHPCPRIKYKANDSEHRDWLTLEKFDTKAARDRRFEELMKKDLIIND